MKKITFLFGTLLLLFTSVATAQTSRVQVIHNCADAAAATVDVYLNGTLLLDNFAFRTATPFIDAPAGVPLTIAVAPGNSTSAAESIYTITPTLMAGETYIIVANGIVSPTGYSPAQPFELSVFAQGREMASSMTATDVLINHGSTDAPAVDVVETSVPVGTIVNDISYPSFTDDYLELIPGDYVVNVTDATGTVVVASYAVPLATLGLQGQAITVLASGFLNPAQNSDGPAFGLWVALASGGDLIPLPLLTDARVQIIHNCADAAAATVDVYVNGNLLLDNFAFRTATPFVSVPSGIALSIDVAPGNSTSAAESIYNIEATLDPAQKYILVANGIVSPTGYAPAAPFELSIFALGRESASNPNNTDVLVNHGSTDAPTVDVVETSIPAGTVVNDISFPEFSADYLELPTSDYILNVTDATGAVVVATYAAPLATLALQGQALTVLASGFLNPAQNSNGPAFGLWVALSSGGNLIPLPTAPLAVKTFEGSNITIYPNPAAELVNINIPFGYNQANVTIADISGRTVLNANNFNGSVDISTLSAGMYVLSMKVDNTVFTTKLVVN